MKILLLNPPSQDRFERSGRWPGKSSGGGLQPPLFLAYTASVLRQSNLNVDLIDAIALGLTRKNVFEEIGEDKTIVVIQTSTLSIDEDLDFIKELKKHFANITIILVGSHTSVYDQEILKENPEVDIIVRGEYDYTIRDIALSKDLKEIKGITYRQDSAVLKNPDREMINDLDELPFPARDLLPTEKYSSPIFSKSPSSYLISSRGCPFRCIFCSWPQTMYGRKLRLRNPQKVVDEIEEMKKQGIKELYFDDDTFGVNKEHIIEICDEMIRRKINLPFICMMRVDCVDKERLVKLKEAGCHIIKYGVESFNQDILKRCKKGITSEQIREAFNLTKKVGIKSYATVMFGLPGETSETIDYSIKEIIKLNPDYVQFSIAMAYPGTEFFEQAKQEKWLNTTDWKDFDPVKNSVVSYPDCSKKEIEQAIHKAYRKFYFRPNYILRKFIKIRSFRELSHLIKGALSLLSK